jgi:bifunctional oligoribonuclease and PAP phosphatase NrnA
MRTGLFDKVLPIIKRGGRFIVTGHEHADGDALGSQVALYYFLRQMGKRVRAINCDEPQKKLKFIDPENVVEIYQAKNGPAEFARADAWIVVDTCAWARIGSLGKIVHEVPCVKITIDHHVFATEEAFADINIIDEKAVATAQLIYQLGRELGCRVDRKIALALYVGIYTDSGGFIYTKMNPDTHRIVAELMEAGVVPYKVFDALYQTHTAAEVELFGRALSSLRFEHGGQIAWMTVSGGMYAYSGADPEGSENYLLNYVRSIKTVELVVLLRQLPEGRVKVSLRSKNFFRVNGIARDLGGGGHWFAAGAVVEGSLPRVHEKVKQLAGREWRNQSRERKRILNPSNQRFQPFNH